jgi:hypothetical protein
MISLPTMYWLHQWLSAAPSLPLIASRSEDLPHPASSPGLALSDFSLFGYIKGKLADYSSESREDLLKAITETFTAVDYEVLRSVFESCLNRLKWVIKHGGSTTLSREKQKTLL